MVVFQTVTSLRHFQDRKIVIGTKYYTVGKKKKSEIGIIALRLRLIEPHFGRHGRKIPFFSPQQYRWQK